MDPKKIAKFLSGTGITPEKQSELDKDPRSGLSEIGFEGSEIDAIINEYEALMDIGDVEGQSLDDRGINFSRRG